MSIQSSPGITILGLGPGSADLLTRQAWDWLSRAGEVYVRTRQHPVIAGLPAQLTVFSFDEVYDRSDRFEDVYEHIVEKILELGQRPQGVTYAVPGHPFVAEATTPEIVRRAKTLGLPVLIIEGLSFIEPTCTALEIDPFARMALVDALGVAAANHPPIPPDMPAIIAQVYSQQVASDLKLTLMAVYPDEHPVQLVHAAGTAEQVVERLRLYEIDRSAHLGLLSALYLPPLGEGTSLEAFQEVVAHLRAPDGCPWDKEQTHLSLRTYLLEETYEALAALDEEDSDGLREELGDLLLQIVLHAQIGVEEGEFTMAEILQGVYRKIVRRHPHVFGEVRVDGVANVLVNWEKLKETERQEKGMHEQKGLLDSVPRVLPGLALAQEIQDRAARVGFDWPDIAPVWEKVKEEFEEVQQAPDERSREKELGDLLFAVVNLVRWFRVDAESTLRETNERFRRRFRHIEVSAREQGRELRQMTLAEMDELWEAAKSQENEQD